MDSPLAKYRALRKFCAHPCRNKSVRTPKLRPPHPTSTQPPNRAEEKLRATREEILEKKQALTDLTKQAKGAYDSFSVRVGEARAQHALAEQSYDDVSKEALLAACAKVGLPVPSGKKADARAALGAFVGAASAPPLTTDQLEQRLGGGAAAAPPFDAAPLAALAGEWRAASDAARSTCEAARERFEDAARHVSSGAEALLPSYTAPGAQAGAPVKLDALLHLSEAHLHEVRGVGDEVDARLRAAEARLGEKLDALGAAMGGKVDQAVGEMRELGAAMKAGLGALDEKVGLLQVALAELMARKPAPLKATGVSAGEARAAGFAALGMRAAGYTIEELIVAGASAAELKAGGYTVDEMKIFFSPMDLKAAGFSPKDLKAAGYTLGEFKAGGFTAADIKASGYSNEDLYDAGYRCYHQTLGHPHNRENSISHCGSCTDRSCCLAANPFR